MEKGKQTVLIIEDQAINRHILRHILENEYDVLEAKDGQEAFHELETHKNISAALLDIVMPVMDGYAFLAKSI